MPCMHGEYAPGTSIIILILLGVLIGRGQSFPSLGLENKHSNILSLPFQVINIETFQRLLSQTFRIEPGKSRITCNGPIVYL